MAILDSVNELAKRFGVETEEQTISEQIDAINQKLDESYTGSRDIEESVSQFAKNDGPDARLGTKSITENGTYTALDDELDGYSSVTVNVAAPTPETFEVEMTVAAGSGSSGTFTASKTLQETINAIKAGKQIDFLTTVDGREVNVICYGVYDTGSGEVVLMTVYDGTSVYLINWMGDGDVYNLSMIQIMVAGTQA